MPRSGMIAFAAGVLAVYCIAKVPSWQVLTGASAGLFLMLGVPPLRRMACWGLVGILGLAWCSWRVELAQSRRLPAALEGQPLTVQGYRCSLVHPLAFGRSRFDLCTSRWRGHAELPAHTRLRLVAANPLIPPAGRELRARVTLKAPRGLVNPAGFRYETWLFRHGYTGTGKLEKVAVLAGDDCSWRCRLLAWRQHLIDAFQRDFAAMKSRPLVASLLFGARNQLKGSQWRLLRRTGTIHLVAISGLHMGLLAGLLGLVCRQLLLWLAGQRVAPGMQRAVVALAVMLGCAFYAGLAGFSVATQRALIMVSVGAMVWALGRRIHVWTAWWLALVLVLLLDPLAPLGAGFWLSFCAVGALIGVFSRRYRRPHPLVALLIAQMAIGAALLPVLTLMGAPLSSLGSLVNLMAIPWVSLVVMPTLVLLVPLGLVVPPWAQWIAPLIDKLIGVFWWGLGEMAQAAHPFYPGNPLLALLMGAALWIALWPVGRPLRMATVAVVALVLIQLRLAHPNTRVASPRVRVFDVGEGLAVLVRSGRHALLYDTGPARRGGYSTVRSILLPSLAAVGVRQLDAVVVDHGHRAGDGDLRTLANNLKVNQWVAGDVAHARARLQGSLRLGNCREATPLHWGPVRIRFWQADPARVRGRNDRSCVVQVRTGQGSILLPGDLQGTGERLFLRGHRDQGRVAVLVAPHRGGADSSLGAWVRRTHPQWVVFSTGHGNRYGHPRAGILARYRAVGAGILNTAVDGALLFQLGAHGVRLARARANAPFWLRDDAP